MTDAMKKMFDEVRKDYMRSKERHAKVLSDIHLRPDALDNGDLAYPPGKSAQDRPFIVYDPIAGSNVYRVGEEMVIVAKAAQCEVKCSFNDIELTATPTDVGSQISDYYSAESERRAAVYRASPEGQRAATSRELNRITKQQFVNGLVASLPLVVADPEKLVRWCCELEEAVVIGVDVPYADIVQKIEQQGHAAHQSTGLDPKAYADDRDLSLRYIIGQCLDCMKGGMPPHQVVHSFVEKLPAKKAS